MALFYFSFLFILPPIINSTLFKSKIENFLNNKTTLSFNIEELSLKTYWNLSCKLSPKLTLSSSYLNNTVVLDGTGSIFIKPFQVTLHDINFLFNNSSIILNGIFWDTKLPENINIRGENLSIIDIHSSLLYFQKKKNNGSKVFIENFKDFDGILDINLDYYDGGFYGSCLAKKLRATTVLFEVPISFENVSFNFDKKKVWAESSGKLGFEPVYTAFILNDMGTSNQTVSGVVKSTITEKLVDKYVKDVKLINNADALVSYSVKNKKIDVEYTLNINSSSDIYYKNANLGLENFNRRLFVKTHKEGERLSITSYDYSLLDGEEVINILLGNGLLEKENGHYKLQYITCKTNGYAPVSVTGSFGEYIDGGFFDGDISFDAKKNKVTGNFTIVESHYKDFYLEKAIVNATEDKMHIMANGTFDDFQFNWLLTAQNDFNNKINIYNMDLFLDEFVIQVGDYNVKTKRTNVPKAVKDVDITINNWAIKLNRISHKKIELKDINLSGSLKNDIFRFIMKDVSFANGQLNANGWYNFNNHSSDVHFSAENIDSNIVADTVFNLKNQISGVASASLHATTFNKLNDISANASFSIDDGYLPKLGESEITLFNEFKLKISDIVKINKENAKAFASDIKGEFYIRNYDMKNINLTSKQKYLSLFVEGDYNINNQYADLSLFGKYNSEMQKKVKIFFIPLSWLTKLFLREENSKEIYKEKLDKVPEISSDLLSEQAFRIKLDGNINNDDFDIQLKRIK